jgi:ubiquinone/menaquinone biosynthesis C-methylase UbiE
MENLYFYRSKIEPGYKHADEVFQEYLCHGNKSAFWVDIGCGKNIFVNEYKSNFSLAFGFDVDSQYVGKAALPMIIGDCRYSSLKDGIADLVTMFMVAEHLPLPKQTLGDIFRILKPKGKFICCTTSRIYWASILNRYMPESLKKAIIYWLFKKNPKEVYPAYYRFNTFASIQQNLANAGYKVVLISGFTDYFYNNRVVFWMQHFLKSLAFNNLKKLMTSRLLCIAEKPIVQ